MRGSNYRALTGKSLVFWIGGHLWEVVAYGGSNVLGVLLLCPLPPCSSWRLDIIVHCIVIPSQAFALKFAQCFQTLLKIHQILCQWQKENTLPQVCS